MTIAVIELCSGYFRQSSMHWAPMFGKQTGAADPFVHAHWGMVQCIAGILGGVVAGSVSGELDAEMHDRGMTSASGRTGGPRLTFTIVLE